MENGKWKMEEILLRKIWRRRGDSNPRYRFTLYGCLANSWFQPLTHSSEFLAGYKTAIRGWIIQALEIIFWEKLALYTLNDCVNQFYMNLLDSITGFGGNDDGKVCHIFKLSPTFSQQGNGLH